MGFARYPYETRFRLIGGALSTPYAPSRNAFADESVTSGKPTLGCYW